MWRDERRQRSSGPQHVAIIMDGNGRWAEAQGLPRLAGHRAGVEAIRPVLEASIELGLRWLTLYAFSTENWARPADEVAGLLGLLDEFLDRETLRLHREGVQIRHLGRLAELPDRLQSKIRGATELTALNRRLTLAVAFNYGGRAEIVAAVRALVAAGVQSGDITESTLATRLWSAGLPDPDLVVRTSGEQRLSNFLIWQAAYSEYWFTPVCWPDFEPAHLHEALAAYGQRQRRYGGQVADAPLLAAR